MGMIDSSFTHVSISFVLYLESFDLWVYVIVLVEQSPMGLLVLNPISCTPFKTSRFSKSSDYVLLVLDIIKVMILIGICVGGLIHMGVNVYRKREKLSFYTII